MYHLVFFCLEDWTRHSLLLWLVAIWLNQKLHVSGDHSCIHFALAWRSLCFSFSITKIWAVNQMQCFGLRPWYFMSFYNHNGVFPVLFSSPLHFFPNSAYKMLTTPFFRFINKKYLFINLVGNLNPLWTSIKIQPRVGSCCLGLIASNCLIKRWFLFCVQALKW